MENSHSQAADYHIHPDFSFDAKGTVDEYCRAALQKGLTEICFTSHYDTDPRVPERHRTMNIKGQVMPVTIENFGAYVEAVHEAHERYYEQGLMIRCGVEVGYYPGCEAEIRELFARYNFHYRLGAIHQVEDIDNCNDAAMQLASQKYGLGKFADLSFEALIKSAECGLFDALAHLDVYKRYGLKYFGPDLLTVHRGRAEKLFKIMAQNETGMEINTSALRKGHAEYYPCMEMVNMARQHGVTIAAIGSDAHRPEDVAFDFNAAAAVAWELFPYCDE